MLAYQLWILGLAGLGLGECIEMGGGGGKREGLTEDGYYDEEDGGDGVVAPLCHGGGMVVKLERIK